MHGQSVPIENRRRNPLGYAHRMRRRHWLEIAGKVAAGSVLGCASVTPSSNPAPRTHSRTMGICFDLFTLFDPRSVVERVREHVPVGADALCDVWRARQFEYAFLRVAGRHYVDFRRITADA